MQSKSNETYWAYMLELMKFMTTTAFDIIPQTIGIIFFNFSGDEKSIGLLGFIISTFYFFFCISYNHSEVINLQSGIHFSNGNFKKFTIKIIQSMLVNLIFFLISIIVSSFSWHILGFLGISGEFLDDSAYYIPKYGLTIGMMFMLTNMTRGTYNSKKIIFYFTLYNKKLTKT